MIKESLALDYNLWPDTPLIPHIHSLLWFLLLTVLVMQFYQSIFDNAALAGLGILLFVINDAHSGAAGWISNRPFPVGVEYKCIQGYVGRTYHVGVFIYGVDFAMPIGSTIVAARAGQVIFVEESFSDQDDGTEKANVVVVQHDDGTFGRYVHLTQNGALVEIGQNVVQGDPIGSSGSSGDPGLPHLHFDVTQECPQSNCQTIPVCFKNTKAHPDGLVTSEFYTAEPH